jgi:opine dehydrogenase
MIKRKIAVLGAGAGGYTFAADFTMLGHTVNMFNRSEKSIKPILDKGGIEILTEDIGEKSPGVGGGPARTGFTKINMCTTNIQEAIKGVEIIFNPVPAVAYRAWAEMAAPYLEDGQIVVTWGKGGGSLDWYNVLKEKGITKNVYLGESNTLAYGTTLMGRVLGEEYANKVRIEGAVKDAMIAAFPGKNADIVFDAVNGLWPEGERQLRKMSTVLETLLMDFNAITHTASMICNAGRIETGDRSFCLFGKDAYTPSVVRVMQRVDEERMDVSRALGYKTWSYVDDRARAKDYYSTVHTLFLEVCEGPFSLKVRHITEDIPYGLVTFASLGDMLNVPTPVTDAVITIASTLNDEDYWKLGRTLDQMGLNPSWTVEQLNKFLMEGNI